MGQHKISNEASNYQNTNSNFNFTSPASSGCTSDFNCRSGYKCMKSMYKNTGQCVKSVNRFGGQTFGKSLNSVGAKITGCTSMSQCPIGFRCLGGNCVR